MSKKNIILQYASAQFAQKGFKGTSMETISKLSGVASATIFYHFNSKEELLIAVLDKVKAAIIDKFNSYAKKHQFVNGIQMIEALVACHLKLALEMPNEFLLLQRYFPYQLAEDNLRCRSHLDEVFNCLVGIFEDAIRTGQKDGSIVKVPVRNTALVLFATLDGVTRLGTFRQHESGTLYQELLRCFHRILRPN
jgi:AcrR family transcriptional regulator